MTTMPTYAVHLRSKTINGLGLKDDTTAQNKLANLIVFFRDWSYKDAIRTVFSLIYNSEIREDILRQFNFTASPEEAEKYALLTDEQIVILGNELRYQYKLSHPKFLEVEGHPDYQKELDDLKKAMTNHPVLFYRAVEACQKCHDSRDIVTSCVEYLMSQNVELQRAGLQRLGNNYQYQRLLQPYAEKIGALLAAMYNSYEEQQKFLAAQEEQSKFPSPFAQLSDMLKQKQNQEELSDATEVCSDTSCIEQPAEPQAEISDNFSKYSLSDNLTQFIKNKSHIVRNLPRDEEFWACLKRLRNVGVNLNDLLDNEQYLFPILEAHDNLDEAISALYDAKEEFAKAQENFQMSDIPSIHALSRAGYGYENAKKAYNLALDTFVSHCRAYEQVTK